MEHAKCGPETASPAPRLRPKLSYFGQTPPRVRHSPGSLPGGRSVQSSGYGSRGWSPPTAESSLMRHLRLETKLQAEQHVDTQFSTENVSRAAQPPIGDPTLEPRSLAASLPRPRTSRGTRVVEAAPIFGELLSTKWARPPTADWKTPSRLAVAGTSVLGPTIGSSINTVSPTVVRHRRWQSMQPGSLAVARARQSKFPASGPLEGDTLRDADMKYDIIAKDIEADQRETIVVRNGSPGAAEAWPFAIDDKPKHSAKPQPHPTAAAELRDWELELIRRNAAARKIGHAYRQYRAKLAAACETAGAEIGADASDEAADGRSLLREICAKYSFDGDELDALFKCYIGLGMDAVERLPFEDFENLLRSAPSFRRLSDESLRSIFRAFGTEETGIDFARFTAALSILSSCPRDQKLTVIFQVYDADQDGYLTTAELERMIGDICANAQPPPDNGEEFVADIVDSLGIGQDSAVSLAEWMDAAQGIPSLMSLLDLC